VGVSALIELRYSADPTCVELAALAALTLRCEAVQDPELDSRVLLLVDGRQVASVYVGGSPRSSEWVSAMAARLAATPFDAGFGGQGSVEALHGAHGLGRYDADRIASARREARLRDARRRAVGPGTVVPVPATTETVTVTATDEEE
jgi:hypothetical protein